MPIIPDYAGVPDEVHLYIHEYSQETAALPSGFRAGVGFRDATLVDGTHGYLEQLSAISPANGFLSTSQDPPFLPHTSQAQVHLFDTHEDLAALSLQDAARQFPPYYVISDFHPTQEAWTDQSFQAAIPPLTNNYGASDFSLTQEAWTGQSSQDAARQFPPYYGTSDFSPTQDAQTDLSSQEAARQFTNNYGASDFFYTGDEPILEVGGPNLFSATPTPVPTFAPTPALSFDASTPGSTVGAPTPMSNFGAPTPAPSFRAPPILQSQAAEKQPPVAIDRAPRQVSLPHTKNNHVNPRRRSSRTSVTPKLYHCSYVYGCKKTFKRKRECIRHMESVHLKPRENGMGNYVCKCLKEFVRKDGLTRHLKKRTDLGTCTRASGPGYFVCQCRTEFDDRSEEHTSELQSQ